LLMLILVAAEMMRVYPDEGEHLVKEMLHYPDSAKKMAKDAKDPNRMNEHPVDFQNYTYEEGWITRENAGGRKCKYPKESRDIFVDDDGVRPDQNCNGGDGDDDLISMRTGMYQSEEQMMRAWEEYGKLVDVCSAWGETDNAEVLSKYIITTGIYPDNKTWCIPKVQRNFGRLLMAKFHIPNGLFRSNGVYGYKLTQDNWIEIATQMWNRSFALKHTFILRQLCAGMFKMCVNNIGDAWMNKASIYDDEGHRMGKIDGDVKLSEMYEQLMQNMNCIDEGHRWAAANALLRALRFKTFGKMSAAKIKELQKAILAADELWKEIDLTEDMCHNPWLFVDSYPIHPELAEELGYTAALVNRMDKIHKALDVSQPDCSCNESESIADNTYLVKGQSESPDMSTPCGAGSARDAGADGRKVAVFLMVGEEEAKYADIERKILVGEENVSSKRKGFASLPGGKSEPCDYEEAAIKQLPFWKCTIIRELREETGYHVNAGSLTLVSMFDFCGCLNYIVYTTKENLSPARFTSGEHERLLDLEWRTPSDIFDKWHSKKISENIWRIIDLKKSDRELRGVFKPYNELTQYKVVNNASVVLFLHHTGTACTSKHSFEIRKYPLEVYNLTKINSASSGSEVSPHGSGRGGRSHHHPRVGEEGATASGQQNISSHPREHTANVVSMRHGRGTGGNGKPPESRCGMAIGPVMKDNVAQNTVQTLPDGVKGALPTERQPDPARSPVSPRLEHTEKQSLRAVVKSDPGLPVAGLSNTDGMELDGPRGLNLVKQLPHPPPSLNKTAEATYNHKRPVDSVRGETGDRKAKKGSGKVGPTTQQKSAGKPTPGKGPSPGTSSKPVASQGNRSRKSTQSVNSLQSRLEDRPHDPLLATLPEHLDLQGYIEDGRERSEPESGKRTWVPKTPSGA
jgi:8-oxo-dGTP pyrophosphatase MutT (NUDIX family)